MGEASDEPVAEPVRVQKNRFIESTSSEAWAASATKQNRALFCQAALFVSATKTPFSEGANTTICRVFALRQSSERRRRG